MLGIFFFKSLLTSYNNISNEGKRKQLSLSLWSESGNSPSKGDGESGADIHEFAIVNEVYR